MRFPIFVFGYFASRGSATPFSSLHLITACIDFNIAVHDTAKEVLPFNTSTCLYDKTEVEPAVNKITARAAIEPQVALVASIALFESEEEPYARAIRAGVAVFFIELGIHFENFEFTRYNMLSMVFFPDNGMGARATGRELCRVRGQQETEHRVALFYGPNPELDIRCDGVVEEFKRQCPDVNLTIVRTLRSPDWGFNSSKELIKPVFLAEPTLTGVITAADIIGIGVNAAADEILPPEDAEHLIVTGFDHADFVIPSLANKRILTTVDQLSNKIASTGMWHTLPNFLKVIADQDLNSTQAVLEYFGLTSHVVLVPTLPIASDGEGQVSAKLAATMVNTVRATPQSGGGPSIVTVKVMEVQVAQYKVDDGAWKGNFWLEMSWYDQRLRWDALQFNGTLSWDVSQLWHPRILLINRQTIDAVITQGRAIIHSDGLVTLRTKYQGDFECSLDVSPFPFTVFSCSIDIGTHQGDNFVIFKLGGFEVHTNPPDYYPLHILGEYLSDSDHRAHFVFQATHNPFFIMSGYISSAWLLNVVTFSQFYLPKSDDRTGFAMATILAAMVLQTEAKESVVFTWLDLFLMLSLLSQVVAFMTSIYARRTVHVEDMDAEMDRMSRSVSLRAIKLQHAIYRMVLVMFGVLDPSMNAADRWARRIQAPTYHVLCILMSFGPMGTSEHPEHGFRCPLFWLGVLGLSPFFVGALALVVKQPAVVPQFEKPVVRDVSDGSEKPEQPLVAQDECEKPVAAGAQDGFEQPVAAVTQVESEEPVARSEQPAAAVASFGSDSTNSSEVEI